MSNDYVHLVKMAERALADAKRQIAEEIASYPTPIAGCDAQFNDLLAERARINAALNALAVEVFIPTPRMPVPAASLESR